MIFVYSCYLNLICLVNFSPGDQPMRPVHSTLSRLGSEYTCAGTSAPIKAELSDERYKAMLIEHKKRRAKKDVSNRIN